MAIKGFFFASFLTALHPLYGCGVLPFGQERTISFNISGFDLPAALSYSPDVTATSVAPTISTTENAATKHNGKLVE